MTLEMTVCSCLAQYGHMPCVCFDKISWDPSEADTRMVRMDLEALQAIGVCLDCGCIEEECECLF